MSYALLNLAVTLTRWMAPPIIFLGIFTNCLNLVILRRPNLKHHSCSFYFAILSLNNLLYSSICITFNFLSDGYQIDISRHSNVLCKLITYLLNFFPHFALNILVLASFDRYCSSSLNAERRKLSSIQTARWLILTVFVFLVIFMIGNAIIFNIDDDDAIGCINRSDSLFNQVYLILQVIVYAMISPFLMILFGFLTIYNIHKSSRNLAVAFRYRPSERQLTRMLIVQVLTHLVLILPFLTIFFMLILPIPFRSTLMFYVLYVIFKIPFYITFITPFFLYILSAQVYRGELIHLLRKLVRIRAERVIHPATTQHMNRSIHTTHHHQTML